MAGRGTDIMLGGNSEYLAKQEMRKQGYTEAQIEQATAFNETEDTSILDSRKKFKELQEKYEAEIKEEKQKVIAAGGLKIIGTERHESRRIDNQLRGRSGRQGDNGESKFFIGLDDDLMKIFGGGAITKVYDGLGVEEDMPIQAKMLSNAVESAQRKVESRNFSIRKNVLQYDDVMREQREIIYKERQEIITEDKSLKWVLMPIFKRTIQREVEQHTLGDRKDWDLKGIIDFAEEVIVKPDTITVADLADKSPRQMVDFLMGYAKQIYKDKQKQLYDPAQMLEFEKVVLLRVVDSHWTDHIDVMDQFRQSVGLRGYGQLNPLVEYQTAGYHMFEQMIADIEYETTRLFMKSQIRQNVTR